MPDLSSLGSPSKQADGSPLEESADKPLLWSVWQNVAPTARRLSLCLMQKPEPPTDDSPDCLASSLSTSRVDRAHSTSRRSSRASPPALPSTVPTADDVIDILYPSNKPNNSADLRHRGDLAHTSGYASSNSDTPRRRHNRSNSAPLSPRASSGPVQPSVDSTSAQNRGRGTFPVDSLGVRPVIPASVSPHTQPTNDRAEDPPLARRSVYRSDGRCQRPTSTSGSWDALLRSAAARSDGAAPVRSRETIARTSLVLTDIPMSHSVHSRTNRDPEALGSDPPPPYARHATDAPPDYDGHGPASGLAGLEESSEENVDVDDYGE